VIARVTDTHALLWYLTDDPRLSEAVLIRFAEAEAGEVFILIPSIVLVEAIYPFEKHRIPDELIDEILRRIDQVGSPYRLAPLDLPVILALRTIDREAIPDMPDRIIAATALAHRVPLISRDRKIQVSNVSTIW